jgi:hypothetical protein
VTPELRRSIFDFETVLNARFPTHTDLNLGPGRRRVLSSVAALRWRFGVHRWPYELKLLQRAWRYRRPEEMGF